MALTYSPKPVLQYGNGFVSRLKTTPLPPGRRWQPMNTAPTASNTPILVANSSGGEQWAMNYRDSWREMEVATDWKSGQKSWRMTSNSVNAKAWDPFYGRRPNQ
jgi:hypothetical protein